MGVSKTNMFARNWRSKLKAKNGTKRVAVRALNFSTRPFCMKFRGGSNRDGPEGQNPQKWITNAKKLLRQKIGLKVNNRVDVKKKNGRVWVFPGTFLHHQILQIVQNFHTNPAVIGVNSRTPRKWPKWDLIFSDFRPNFRIFSGGARKQTRNAHIAGSQHL